MDGSVAYKLDNIVEEGDWNQRYVRTLIRMAGQYLKHQELDLAKSFLEEARLYDNGIYRGEIEVAEFHLGIEETFLTARLSEYLK